MDRNADTLSRSRSRRRSFFEVVFSLMSMEFGKISKEGKKSKIKLQLYFFVSAAEEKT